MINRIYSLPSGPKIALEFLPRQNRGFQIQISEHSIFTFSFFVKFPISLMQELLNWQKAYSYKEPLPILNLPRQNLPTFTENVLRIIKTVPLGKTLSYGEIALQSGSPKAHRAVGTICRLNAWPLFIPCHRVLPKNGTIGSYAFGPSIKQAILEFESALTIQCYS